MRKLTILTALTAAAVYFLNPEHGARRRASARGRLLSLFGAAERTREPAEHAFASDPPSFTAQAPSPEHESSQPDDVTLARMVESELFRDQDVPKHQINVNAENGKIVLRGEVEQPEMIADLEERARKIRGVQEVENLLHMPGTPSPMHQ